MDIKTIISVLLTILVGYSIIQKKDPNSVADMVSKISPALVHIMMADRLLNNSTESPESPSGSGFIIDTSGLILTNAHVATANPGSNSTINVQLPVGQICEGLLESLDVFLDLALIKINCLSTPLLPIMKLGDSDTLRAGDAVVALGSPLSLSNTVTMGVISNTARSMAELEMTGGDEDRKFLQTDAFITFGNSGGPLVNLEGEVVGINTMGTPGCSFAIPINVAKKFLSDAAAGVVRDRTKMQNMGMSLLELNSIMIEQMQHHRGLGKSVTHGLMVMDVSMGSPADVAGMEQGDVIFQMDGKDIHGILDFSAAFWAGEGSIEIKVKRGDLEVIITV